MILKQLVTLSSPKQKAVELMKTHNYMLLGSATLPPSFLLFLPSLLSPLPSPLLVDLDVKFSATAPVLCLSPSHHDDQGLNL